MSFDRGTDWNSSPDSRNRAGLWRRRLLRQSIKPWLLLWAIFFALPCGLSYWHFHDWLTYHKCLLIGFEDHVDLHCARPSSMQTGLKSSGRRIETSHMPGSVVELSSWLFDAGYQQSRVSGIPLSSAKQDAIWNGKSWKLQVQADDLTGVSSFAPLQGENGVTQNSGSRFGWHKSGPITFATGCLCIVNGGIFFWLWNSRIDPSRVVLNGQIFHDFGRALTGNLSHFDLLHIGFNMMTLSSLGSALEHNVVSTISMLLYSISFLPITTLVIICLHHIQRRYQGRSTEVESFPSMVGFSGILFAWIVVSALEGSLSCPIFFLPDMCFSTYTLWGGFRMSIGPLIQLVFLQVILPRVSFIGHLAGIAVGFLWYWNLFPPLEWSQPAVLFPTLWILLKLVEWNSPASRGGRTTSTSQPSYHSKKLRVLRWVRALVIVHFVVCCIHLGPLSSMVLTEVLQTIFLSLMLRFGSHSEQVDRFEACCRAETFMCLLWTVMDGFTLGGWLATRQAWSNTNISFLLLATKDCILLTTFSILSYNLEGSSFSASQEGTWQLCLGSLVQFCQPVGKVAVELFQLPDTRQDNDEQEMEAIAQQPTDVSDVL